MESAGRCREMQECPRKIGLRSASLSRNVAGSIEALALSQYVALVARRQPSTILQSPRRETLAFAQCFDATDGGFLFLLVAAVSDRWVKVWVAIADHPILGEDDALLGLFVKLICKANWKQGSAILRRQRVSLKRGQLVTSYRKLAVAGGCSENTMRRRMQILIDEGMVGVQPGAHGLLVTIKNYDRYQVRSETHGAHLGAQTDDETAEQTDDISRRYIEESRYTPPISPPRGGDGRTPIDEIVARVFGSLRAGHDAEEARRHIGDDGWNALLVEYPDWDGVRRAARSRKPITLRRELARTLAAVMPAVKAGVVRPLNVPQKRNLKATREIPGDLYADD